VVLLVDKNVMIKIFHSPKNFGGMLLHPLNKVPCLTGLGCLLICKQLNVTLAVSNCKMNNPSKEELAAYLTAQDVRDLPVPNINPNKNGVFSYKDSNIMLPAP
jgi:hypothetical protein